MSLVRDPIDERHIAAKALIYGAINVFPVVAYQRANGLEGRGGGARLGKIHGCDNAPNATPARTPRPPAGEMRA